jgi:molybdenum cofactor cytidylyltransferase
MRPKLAGVILSAGRSQRMGRPKALLEYGGATFLERIVGLASAAHLEPIKIVVSGHGDRIEQRHPQFAAMLINNDRPELGQLHSLHLALRSLPDECDGAMVFLIDHPAVKDTTLTEMITTFARGPAQIIIPICKGRRGHPVIFRRSVFADLFSAPLETGARHVVRARPKDVALVEVGDPGIYRDIDTPADYEELQRNG